MFYDIEKLMQENNDKMVNIKINRKDILVNCVFPLHIMNISHEVFFHEKEDHYVPQGTVDFYGYFGDYDNKIHIDIVFNPNDTEYYWNFPLWAYIRSIYIDTLCHEFMHLNQYEKRLLNGITTTQRNPSFKEFKSIEQDDEFENGLYLIKPDEVEAHAYNFASQLFRRYRNIEESLEALRKCDFDNIEIYDFYSKYIKKNSYIFKRLLKKTTWYLIHKYDENNYINSECNEDVVENKE